MCLRANNNVVFKICVSDRNAEKFRAVIIEGQAERLTDYNDVLHALRSVARQVALDEHALDSIAKRNYQNAESNFIRIPIRVIGGTKREGGKFTVDAQ
jgi:hypothetical protein